MLPRFAEACTAFVTSPDGPKFTSFDAISLQDRQPNLAEVCSPSQIFITHTHKDPYFCRKEQTEE